jgi:hypothetical protein
MPLFYLGNYIDKYSSPWIVMISPGGVPDDRIMRKIKNIINFSRPEKNDDSRIFWISRSREERVEAVETIREHHYQMLGYRATPRIKKIISII